MSKGETEMEFYKLPDLSKEYSLDYYKDILDGIAVFSYKDKKGRYESRWVNGVLRHILIIDNIYYAYTRRSIYLLTMPLLKMI
jgi:hypothetical protein